MNKTLAAFAILAVTFLSPLNHTQAAHPFSRGGAVIDLPNTASFFEIIKQGNVLVKFTADFCPPCKNMEPVLARIAQTFSQNLLIVRVDVNKFPNLRNQYNIRSWPTLLFFRNGGIARMVQGANLHELESMVRTIFSL